MHVQTLSSHVNESTSEYPRISNSDVPVKNQISPQRFLLQSLEIIGSQALMHYGSPAEILGEFHGIIGDVKNLPKRLAQELVEACKAHGVTMGR